MRILQLIDNSIYGGAERHTLLISRALLKMGHDLVLLCPPGPFVEEYRTIENYGGRVFVIDEISRHYFNPLRFFQREKYKKACEKVLELLNKEGISLIHSHMPCADYIVYGISSSIPQVIRFTTLHNIEAMDHIFIYRYIRKPFIKRALSKFDRIFTLSQSVMNILKDYFDIHDGRMCVLNNAIDPEELDGTCEDKKEVRKKLNLEENERLILCLGEYCERKGQKLLIECARLLRERGFRNFKFVLAGLDKSNYAVKTLKPMIEKFKLNNEVFLAGFWKDRVSLLKACDIYIQPSLWDPVPRSLLEAMYVGKVCVASKINGIKDVIENGSSGFLVEPHPEKIFECLRKILSGEIDEEKIKKRAREKILKDHIMSYMAQRIIKEYEEIMRNKSIEPQEF